MVFKVTITIEWNGCAQPLGSMVFQWFWVRQPLIMMVFDGWAPLVRRWNGYVPSSKSNSTPHRNQEIDQKTFGSKEAETKLDITERLSHASSLIALFLPPNGDVWRIGAVYKVDK